MSVCLCTQTNPHAIINQPHAIQLSVILMQQQKMIPPLPSLTGSLLQVIWNVMEISIEMILLTGACYLQQPHTKQTAWILMACQENLPVPSEQLWKSYASTKVLTRLNSPWSWFRWLGFIEGMIQKHSYPPTQTQTHTHTSKGEWTTCYKVIELCCNLSWNYDIVIVKQVNGSFKGQYFLISSI